MLFIVCTLILYLKLGFVSIRCSTFYSIAQATVGIKAFRAYHCLTTTLLTMLNGIATDRGQNTSEKTRKKQSEVLSVLSRDFS